MGLSCLLLLGAGTLGCSSPGDVEGSGGESSAGERGLGGAKSSGGADAGGMLPSIAGERSDAGQGGQGPAGGQLDQGGQLNESGQPNEGGQGNESGQPSEGGQGNESGEGGQGINVTPGHLVVSDTALYLEGDCAVAPGTLTITNDGGSPITWHGTVDETAYYAISPTASTLGPGDSTEVTVSSPVDIDPEYAEPDGVLTISSNDVAEPALAVALSEQIFGFRFFPDDIDLGDVFVSSSTQVTVAAPSLNVPGLALGGDSSNLDFSKSGYAPNDQGEWVIEFRPSKAGTQKNTYAFLSFFGDVCPPSSFVVTGNGVYHDCASSADDTQCGYASYCTGGSCALRGASVEADLYPIGGGASRLDATVFFTELTRPDATGYAASIAWGDGTTSPAQVTGSSEPQLSLVGDHTYAASGPVNGSITLTDNLTGVSETWPFSGEAP